jgi:DNA-binding beta-propeller fold protein YncE
VIKGTEVPLGSSAGFRGLVWTPDGEWLAASTEHGHIQLFRLSGSRFLTSARIAITPKDQSANPVPGGITISRDGSRLFVAAAHRNAVVLVDVAHRVAVKEYPVQNLPFEPRLSEDESTLTVSNWGGRLPRPGERTANSQYLDILVDVGSRAAV